MPRPIGNDKNLLKLERYCLWQERCEAEVLSKLEEMGIPQSDHKRLLKYLHDHGYLDETRYAGLFAGGKFRMKNWGRIKISYALTAKGISEKLINIGLNSIDQEEYEAVLKNIIKAKYESLANIKDPYQRNYKTSLYAIGKGFEPDLVWEIIKQMK